MSEGISPDQHAIVPHQEQALQQASLENALAYKDKSGELLSDSINEVQRLLQGGNDIYPAYFPSWRYPEEAQSIRVKPNSPEEGRLAPAEGAAVQVLSMEHAALNQALGQDLATSKKITEALKMEQKQWPTDVVGGIGDFGNALRSVTKVREWILSGKGKPEGKSIGSVIDATIWDRYNEAVKADGMKIGENTAQAIVNAISLDCPDEIKGIPEGATESQIPERIASRIHGATLAQALYVEALRKAGTRLDSSLSTERKVETQPVNHTSLPKFLLSLLSKKD